MPRERYIEKESELEEILLADKLEKIEIFDRYGKQFKLTEARWQRFTRLLKQYEGWALCAARPVTATTSSSSSRSPRCSASRSATAEAAVELLGARRTSTARRYATELVGEDAIEIRVKAVEASTGFARTHRDQARAVRLAGVPPARRACTRSSIELAGTPAVRRRASATRTRARSPSRTLRAAVLTVAQKGVELQRFKGLGEMNADSSAKRRWPRPTRTLAQVTLEDAVAADRVFSMLMGDQVEPRRAVHRGATPAPSPTWMCSRR